MNTQLRRCSLAVALSFGQPFVAHASDDAPLSYAEAEQFVHGNLYDAVTAVMNADRQAWNQLLNVHACGSDEQEQVLSLSYESAQPLFSQAMLTLAEANNLFQTPTEKAILDDVSQLAYRLFSNSYAHGYARQVGQMDQLSPGLQDEMCDYAPVSLQAVDGSASIIDYAGDVNWQISLNPENTDSQMSYDFNNVQSHAVNGYQAFNKLLNAQYEQFDALVFSHAYQVADAYDTLFFQVNRYENVIQYQQFVDADIKLDEEQATHADFAYLVLSSGYHWGTLSVLAMLEETYPRVHAKAKDNAMTEIKRVTESLNGSQNPTVGI